MDRDIKQEFCQSMDSLRFSDTDKEAMVKMLTKELNQKSRRRGGRKLLVLALAATIALVTLTGAAVYTRMSRSVSADYQMTEKQKQTAEKSGLSVMLEETKEPKKAEEPASVISVTDQGITISAVQTLVDKYRARLVFRIAGFDLPEGEYPSVAGGVVSINGKEFPVPEGGWINNGMVVDPVTETATYADGSPLQYDKDGAVILRPLAADGSFEFCIALVFPTEQNSGLGCPDLEYMEHLGSEIVVKITNIGIQDGLNHVPMVDGDWTLKWTLTGSDITKTVEPHAAIGDSGFTLLNAEITPLSCILTMEGDAYSHKSRDTGESFYWIPNLVGVVLKDGTIVPKPSYGGGAFGEIAHNIHVSNDELSAIEMDQIQSLAFYNMGTKNGQPFYIVPIG